MHYVDYRTSLEVRLAQEHAEGLETVVDAMVPVPPAPSGEVQIVVSVRVDGRKRLWLKTTVVQTASVQEFGPFPVC